MSSHESKTTDNHDTIKNWVEERHGEPGVVEGVVDKEKAGEMLRIYFPGPTEESVKNISWEVFFKIFDENNLAFLYQEEIIDGDQSTFCKIINKNRNAE